MNKLKLLLIFLLLHPFQNVVRANNHFGTKNIANLKQRYYQQQNSREKEDICFKEKVPESWEGKYHFENSGGGAWARFNGKSTILVYQDRVVRWSQRFPDYKCKVDVFYYFKPYYYVKNDVELKGYGMNLRSYCIAQQIYKVIFEFDKGDLLAYETREYPFITEGPGAVKKVDVDTEYFAKILESNWTFDDTCDWQRSNGDQYWDITIGDVIQKPKKSKFFK